MTTRAAIYARLSQDRDGDQTATARQEADCRAVAERNGWEVVQTFEDVQSAFGAKQRPGWKAMLADAERGLFDVLIAYHDDRLWRNVTEQQLVFSILSNCGVEKIATANRVYTTDSGDDAFLGGVQALVAQRESVDKRRRLRSKHLELAQKGMVSGGGRRPFGYEEDRLTIREGEAALIRDAATRVLDGETLSSIIRDWHADGVKTVTGAPWSTTTLKRLLCSARISGQREHRGEIVGKAVWPAIITPEHTARLRALLTDPSRNRVAGVQPRSYLLTGFVVCGRCNVKMTSRPTRRGKRRYVCARSRGGCDRCGISADGLEGEVVEGVLSVLAGPGLRAALDAEKAEDPEQAELVAEVKAVQGSLDQLHDDYYVQSVIDRPAFIALNDRLRGRLDSAKRALARRSRAAIVHELPADVDGLRAAWTAHDLHWRRRLLAVALEAVVVAPTTRANNRFDADRVSYRWKL